MEAIVNDKAEPRNRNESELACYRDELATIHESLDHISLALYVLPSCIGIYPVFAASQTAIYTKIKMVLLKETDAPEFHS